jgi:hypothetical protein
MTYTTKVDTMYQRIVQWIDRTEDKDEVTWTKVTRKYAKKLLGWEEEELKTLRAKIRRIQRISWISACSY